MRISGICGCGNAKLEVFDSQEAAVILLDLLVPDLASVLSCTFQDAGCQDAFCLNSFTVPA